MSSRLQAILEAVNVQDVWVLILDYLEEIGFKHALYGFTRFHTSSGLGDHNDHLFLTNFGPGYMKGYFEEGRYRNGPMVRWALENVGAKSWQWIGENFDQLTEEEREVAAFNQRWGVTAGYTVAFQHAIKRAKGAIGMSLAPFSGTQEEADEIWARHGTDVEVICGVAHLKIISLPLPRRILTSRQREVLEWIGDGKTVRDTAEILGLNKATVEKHLRLAREALGVETTAQAVLKASFHNQIFTF
ncbi:helix-turn-helix transcriptional regulator [Celeribacter indicus]|uniref:LuxR family autoinducer-binding transcriptional regulator n=1 Tax=Celeribacter indicus TaxID=1208324 RepID=A0A0B5DV39_9RHOB|nr:LuxR family transcriptional regulator [Celeribacter indicus]AJE47268.1 LuxR family autoinducer-binding transcriptional regulator [Celeribacter indicus]